MGTTQQRCLHNKLLLGSFLVILIFLNGIIAESCKTGCPKSDNGKLKYSPGNVYEYSFDSDVAIGLQLTEYDETSLRVQGLARLYPEGNCAYTLQLDRITVRTTREQLQKQLAHGIQKPIRFTMFSGELEPQLCADPTESEHALNIKRAIISMFQSAEGGTHETDIFGVCPIEKSISHTGSGSEIITTMRNLNSCGYRENLVNGFVSSVINHKSGIKSTPYLSADYSREQKLTNGIYETISLVEEYEMAPASSEAADAADSGNRKYGAKAKVKTTLKLQKQGPGAAPQLANGKPESIIFSHPSTLPIKNLEALRESLKKTINLVNGYAKSDSAQHFTELIRLMRQADTETLIELSIINHENRNLGRKVYLDALFRAGTSDSVKAIVKQIPKMNEKEKRLAFLSFMLVESVGKDALQQVSGLLNPQSPREAYLSIGHLVNKYCKEEQCDDSEVLGISKKFVDSLRHCKAANKNEETRIVGVLKGIRNTKKIADTSARSLIECAAIDKSARLRVAALQAFSAASCNENLQSHALTILKDRNEDSEIRIEAYLAAVACPNGNLANELAEIVNTETVNQVGGFLTTHLKAIRDSTDFTREQARYHLGNIRITKKFPIDPRRFSFNSELSYAVESLGIGAATDYSLIYSQNGFLPRSVRWNLTTEVFGRSFNLLDMSARQENLEEVLEYYLGPKGFFSRDPQEILDEIHTRAKRSVADDTNKMLKSYKLYGNQNYENDLNLDLSLKMFGSEFAFLSLGDHIPSSSNELVGAFANLYNKMKDGAKNYEKLFEYHTMFQDTEMVYPTGSGFPLEIIEQNVATGKLDLATEIDLDKILADPKNSRYRVKMIPSIDMHFNVQLRIDSGVLATGLRASSNFHSATGGDYKLELFNDGTGFNLNTEMPRDNIELIELKYDVDFYIAEQNKAVRFLPLKQTKRKRGGGQLQEKCFDQLDASLGLQICYVADLPEQSTENLPLSFPFTGPAHIGLSLKTERQITFKGLYQHHQDHQSWLWTYDTPGSQKPHETNLRFELGATPKLYARLSLDNPQMRYAVETGVQNDDREFTIYGSYDVNGDVKLSKIGFTKNGNEYRPLIQMQDANGVRNDIAGYKADGRVIVNQQNEFTKYNFDNFRIIKPTNEQTIINGWVDLGKDGYKSELKVQDGEKSLKIDSHLNLDLGAVNNIRIGAFVTDEKQSDSTIGGSLALELSERNLKHEFKLQAGDHHFELDIDLESDETRNHIKFLNNLIIKNTRAQLSIAGKLNGELSDKLVHINFEANRNDKRLAFLYKYAHDQKSAGDYELEINGKLNRHFVDIKSQATLNPSTNKFAVNHQLLTSWGTKITVQGDCSQRLAAADINLNLNGLIQLTRNDKEYNWNLRIQNLKDKQLLELKLISEQLQLLTLNAELTKPQDQKPAIGNLNLTIKDKLNAKGEIKLNKNGRGISKILINVLKSNQKYQIDTKFHVASPTYDLDTTILFNNQEQQKIHYKTENQIEHNKFATKNNLNLNGEVYVFEAAAAIKSNQQDENEFDGKFDLILPIGRKLNGHVRRKMNFNTQNGVLELGLNDQLAGGEKRSLEVSGKLNDFNRKLKNFQLNYNVLYTNFNGNTIQLQLAGKNLPKSPDSGSVKTAGLDVVLSGTELAENMKFILNVDEYSAQHIIYQLNAKYGGSHNLNLNGNLYLNSNNINSYELAGTLFVPDSPQGSYSIKSNGKLIKADTENGIHDLLLNTAIKYGQNELTANLNVKGNQEHGSYSLQTNCPWHGPMSVDGSYMNAANSRDETYSYNLKYNLGKYGNCDTNFNMNYVINNSLRINYKLQSSYENAQIIDLALQMQKQDAQTYSKELQLNLNGQKYLSKSTFYSGEIKSGLDAALTTPSGEIKKFMIILENQGEFKSKAAILIENIAELDLKANGEINYQSYEDFHIQIELNSRKLNLNNINANVQTTNPGGSGGGKGIQFKITKLNNENILSGNAKYLSKVDKGKVTFEGQGLIVYLTEEQNINFKLVCQQYDNQRDNEIGYSYTFNGTFGPKNIVSTLKKTNKDFHIKLAACEQSKQCTNFEIRSLLRADDDLMHIQHELMILIDLRELKFPYEFELQAKTTNAGGSGAQAGAGGLNNLVQEIEMNIISNNNNKYQLLINLKPEQSLWKLKLPKREIVLETKHKLPLNSSPFGQYENVITFYFDRLNNPNDRTELQLIYDLNGSQKEQNFYGKFNGKFIHPQIKTLAINGDADLNLKQRVAGANIELDIFDSPAKKIIGNARAVGRELDGGHGYNYTSEARIRSQGLNFEYHSQAHAAISFDRSELSVGSLAEIVGTDLKFSTYVYSSKDNFEILLISLNRELLQLNGDYNLQQHKAKVNGKMNVFGGAQPITMSGEFEPHSMRIDIKRDGLFELTNSLSIGREAKFVIQSGGKPLYNAQIALDAANFLATNYEINDDNVRNFIKHAENEFKRDTQMAQTDLKAKIENYKNKLSEQIQLIQHSAVDVSRLRDNYVQNINGIVKELEEDPALKELFDTYRNFYDTLVGILNQLHKDVTEFYQKLQQIFDDAHQQLSQIIKEKILPAWEESMSRIINILSEFYAEAMKIMGTTFERGIKALKSVEVNLQSLGKPLAEALRPFGEMLAELIRTVSKEWSEFWSEIEELLKKLPSIQEISNQLRDRLAHIGTVEDLLKIVKEVFTQLEEMAISPELKEFIRKLYVYIDAKLRQSDINDVEQLEGLYSSLVGALKEVLHFIDENSAAALFFQPLPFSFEALSQIPTYISFRFSPLNYLRNEKLNSLNNWLSFNPTFDLIPPYELRGHVADGQHIFSFDGRHMTFPGSCRYILAQDYVNNNFSVVATLDAGKMKSIVVIDKSGYIEVNDQGQVQLNGKPSEYPIHELDLNAWRRYYSVSILSAYGVSVKCSIDLRVCHVNVNGYYTGKLRGLLGNGNAEQYDDFTIPDGRIVQDYAQFGNKYALGSCQPVAANPQHLTGGGQHERSEICSEMFAIDSSLMFGYIFIDSAIYREACDHAVARAQNKLDAACNIAFAYASAGRMDHLPLRIPEKCLKCNANTLEQREIGEEFETKIPSNKADVVFVVDTSINDALMTGLLQPVLQDLKGQLKQRGMSDVNVAVIGYNNELLYPGLFTTNGKLNFNGQFASVKLDGPKRPSAALTDLKVEKLNEILGKFKLVSSYFKTSEAEAFTLALNYPFRANAAKTVISVRNHELKYEGDWLDELGSALSDLLLSARGVSLHVIGPVKDLQLDGSAAEKIVGFNQRAVAFLERRDTTKRDNLRYAKDLGYDVVQNYHGWVFALQNFENLKNPDQKKQFVHQVSSAVADQLFKTEIVNHCTCDIEYGLYGEDKCLALSTNFVVTKRGQQGGAAAKG